MATGYRNTAPLKPCPSFTFDPETGTVGLDLTLRCRDTEAFVLTPQ